MYIAPWKAGFLLLFAVVCRGEDATIAGPVDSPYPTITNLAVEWKIAGDDNLNGVVSVRYRRVGETAWRAGMPLRRVPAGSNTDSKPHRSWDNKHSGSIFDLRPGAEYEIELKLSDPDGGAAQRTIRARTRPVPRAAAAARVRPATPATLARVAAGAQPGEIVLLAKGNYGAFAAPGDGRPGRPIVYRAEDSGAVFESVSLRSRRHVHLEGVTVNGSVDLLGGEELTVRRCTVNATFGIIASKAPGARNCYIADNVVTGTMPWDSPHMGPRKADGTPACIGEGIQITGPGNVICHNRLKGYRDAISFMEDRGAGEQMCIDVYNNDIYVADDDAVEADFCMGNCRVMRNRITNCFVGVSSQPGLGGPTYFIRNVMYNLITVPFKLSRFSVGDVLLHNTAVKIGNGLAAGGGDWSHAMFRNNLCIGGKGGGVFGWRYSSGSGQAASLPGPHADADYDGAGTVGTAFAGKINGIAFEGLAQMRELTTEKHGVQAGLDVFQAAVEFPDPPFPERPVPDLRLRKASAAVDAGVAISNINDGYSGAAPDLGAYELGADLPIYGPRPIGVDESTTGRGRDR